MKQRSVKHIKQSDSKSFSFNYEKQYLKNLIYFTTGISKKMTQKVKTKRMDQYIVDKWTQK